MSSAATTNKINPIKFDTLSAMQAADVSTIPTGALVYAVDTQNGKYMYDATSTSAENAGDVYPNAGPGVFKIADVGVIYLDDNNQLTSFNGVDDANSIPLADNSIFVGNSSGIAAPVPISAVQRYTGKYSNTGGSATVVISVTGVLTSDNVDAVCQSQANAASVLTVSPTANTITVVFSADPGVSVISYEVYRMV